MKQVSGQTHGQASEPNPEKRPIRYFLPDQIILHMKHPPEVDLVSELDKFFSENSEEHEWKNQIKPPTKDAILTFPIKDDTGQVFSIVRAQLIDENKLAGLLNEINSKLQIAPMTIAPGITLRSTSPNWLISGASEGSGTGGPGSWPVKAQPPSAGNWLFKKIDKTTNAVSELTSPDRQGEGVKVVILDTAPSQKAMDDAYLQWHGKHPLIDSLLIPGGPLCLHPALPDNLEQIKQYDLLGHRYLMSDHGLFIAGIIHTIAPKAILHLYEVLNPYGIGTFDMIARGLLQVLQNPDIKEGDPLIINCSFMLSIPVGGTLNPDFPTDIEDPNNPSSNQTLSLTDIFNGLIKRNNTTIVAAAGNDTSHYNNRGNGRPDTRYPAAFSDVLGIGALPKGLPQNNGKFETASYSNLSDEPTEKSYITLGGEPGVQNGVLGLFIGEFPEYDEFTGCLGLIWSFLHLPQKTKPGFLPSDIYAVDPKLIKYYRNTTGWAWWAGTSFSTPIVSGVLAANYKPSDVLGPTSSTYIQDTLRNLFTVNNGTTPQYEKVLPITQQ